MILQTRHFFPFLVATALLSGCASVTLPETSPRTATPENLPAVDLDGETLYQILLGEIAGKRGHTGAAATLGQVAQKTRDPRLAERATLAALDARRFEEALKSAQLWVELRPHDIEAHEALAVVWMELDRLADAQRQFETMLALDREQNSPDQGYMRVAAVLSRTSNRAASLKTMQQLVQAQTRLPAAQFALALLAVRIGDLDQAQAATEQALKLRPDWEEAALFRARILVSQKDLHKAQQFYEAFLKDYPAATNFRHNYARYLIDQKLWEQARKQFLRVMADRPNDADTVFAVGLLSLQLNQLDDAEKYLRRTLVLQPQNEQARVSLGQVAEQQKQYANAAQTYRDVGPGEYYFEAQLRLAVVMARQGELVKARAHLHALMPESTPQFVQRALSEEQILRDARQYPQALEVLNAAIVQLPGDKDLLYARALVAEKLNMIDLAEADLRTVIKQDSKNAHALNALGYTLADHTTRYREAQELLTQALALRSDDAFILDSMGWLHYRLGNYSEAVRYLKRALELRSDAEISAHLGEVLWVMGNRKEAESVWERALRETPDNEALVDVVKKYKQ
jgi:Tfp pilus assembly protein PilF